MSFLYFWENKQRKMTEMLRNITNSKECQNLADSGGLCLETHLKTYYNKAQLWRKRIRENRRNSNGVYSNHEGYDNRRTAAD